MKNDLAQRLLETGWQSWSVSNKRHLFSLKRDFNPLPNEFNLPSFKYKNKKTKKPIIGWCSWYAFGRNIGEDKILDHVNWFKKTNNLPVKYILIDDGWCKWGDWLINKSHNFPNGIKDLSNKIKKLSFKSGIWIAPFLVEEDSFIYKNHKNWLIGENGEPKNGLNWTIFDDLYFKRYLLDIRLPEVRQFIYKVIDTLAKDYKFDLIKLDFLYAIYFIPNTTSEEAGGFIRGLFEYIKKKYPDVYTIACGSPLVPVVGVVDSVRIGPDTAFPAIDGIPVISSISHLYRMNKVLSNLDKRMWTQSIWNIDPDAFVSRKSLGIGKVKLFKLQNEIIRCKGNIFLGDDMTKLSQERIEKYILPLFKR